MNVHLFPKVNLQKVHESSLNCIYCINACTQCGHRIEINDCLCTNQHASNRKHSISVSSLYPPICKWKKENVS